MSCIASVSSSSVCSTTGWCVFFWLPGSCDNTALSLSSFLFSRFSVLTKIGLVFFLGRALVLTDLTPVRGSAVTGYGNSGVDLPSGKCWKMHVIIWARSCENASTQTDQHLCCLLLRWYDMYTCYIQSFKILVSFCSWAGWFECYLVENLQRHIFEWCGSYDIS